MTESDSNKAPEGKLPVSPIPRADQIVRGPDITPQQRVTLYSSAEWEIFIQEWLEALKDKGDYQEIARLGGAGDQGRDVIAYTGDSNTNCPWDNYQCKHYDHSLNFSDICIELGKLCYYTFNKEYTVPKAYYFVAPKDWTTQLWKFVSNPETLKQKLIEKWGQNCQKKITTTKEILLEGGFKQYVENFDFTIVKCISVLSIIKQHQSTPYYVTRFGGGLPDRPLDKKPPAEIATTETRYVRQLLNAYGDNLKTNFENPDSLPQNSEHQSHFNRSREHFYCAETLYGFSRDTVPPGTFEALQDEIYSGVVDIAESTHKDGFVRVKETVKAAQQLQIQDNALVPMLNVKDRSGICHQLANADKLIWVKGK